nr:unnamed protein product [Callosobruchus analis]
MNLGFGIQGFQIIKTEIRRPMHGPIFTRSSASNVRLTN